MKVLVGLSGGIDSSVAARLLVDAGHEVEGATMLIWRPDSPYPAPASPGSCYSPARAEDKAHIAAFCACLGIPYRTIDCTRLYESQVLGDFRSEYLSGRTPNPCVWCNAKIKFGALLDYAREEGVSFDKFATGHYARITQDSNTGRWELRKAKDLKKDQSYFLYRLSQEQLSSTLFPLGDLTKDEVRRMDVEWGYHPEGQAESQDFYGGDYSDLLGVEDRPGAILDTRGRVIGTHRGHWRYTIGQRRGIGVAGPEPYYVMAVDAVDNTVTVGAAAEAGRISFTASQVNWVSREDFEEGRTYQAKLRSASPGVPALVEKTSGDTFRVVLLSPEMGVSPGQSCVVYDGDLLVAGGIVD